MRETNTIALEIVELSEIKSAYNHFLASYEGQVDIENATYIRNNKAIVSENLKKLYVELEKVKSKIAKDKHHITTNKYQAANRERATRHPHPPHEV